MQLGDGDASAAATSGLGKLQALKPFNLANTLNIQPTLQPLLRGTVPGADTLGGFSKLDQANKGSRSLAAQQPSGIAAHSQQQPHMEASAAVAAVKQPLLVKDVLRAVQGLKGAYMQYPAGPAAANPSNASAGLMLAGQEQACIPEGQRTLVHELGELGLMFNRVQAAIREGQQPGAGSVRQALCGALYEQVTDFYRLVAVLESQLAVPIPAPGTDAASAAGQGTYLTLRRLQLWLAEPLRRMRLLAALVDVARSSEGGLLAGQVWAASKVGDPIARAYATRLLQQVCVPLFDMIRHWVFDGQLQDPALEFFIQLNAADIKTGSGGSSGGTEQQQAQAVPGSGSAGSVAPERDLWREAYKLELANLPPFITQDLAKTIERAGKSINFLRDACGDRQWVQDWAPAAAGAAAALGYGQLPVLERVVVSASRSVDARLMAVLRSTGEWDRHCSAVRRFLLLGQGDFVVAFLDVAGPELDKNNEPSTSADAQLNHLLRQALLSCSGGARLDEEANGPLQLLRLEVSKSSGTTEKYWNLFSMRYNLGQPLASIFTREAQAKYNRLSKLLWMLRRAERALNDTWRILKVEVERELPRFKGDACVAQLDDLLRTSLRVHAEMAHITTNLQYYINLEVVECAWSEFMAAAAAAPNLDCLIAAHDNFLSRVLDRALLGGGKAEGLRRTLNDLLTNCMDLHTGVVNNLKVKVKVGTDELTRREEQVKSNTAAGAWGSSGNRAPAIPLKELVELKGTMRGTEERHKQLLQAFLTGLPEAANEVNAEVRFLLARLDFSDFYKGK